MKGVIREASSDDCQLSLCKACFVRRPNGWRSGHLMGLNLSLPLIMWLAKVQRFLPTPVKGWTILTRFPLPFNMD
jgi:hypothetical protein